MDVGKGEGRGEEGRGGEGRGREGRGGEDGMVRQYCDPQNVISNQTPAW